MRILRNVALVTLMVMVCGISFAQMGKGTQYGQTGQTGQYSHSGYQIDRNDQVVVGLLTLVLSDLQMCGASLRQGGLIDNVSAIGALNNSQSALKAANLDAAYAPLVRELLDRIGKVKFYLVMRDFNAVSMRLNQLLGMVNGMLTGNTNMSLGSGYSNYGNGTFQYQPQGSGMNVPVLPREMPVNGSTPISPMGLPGGVRPPNN